MKKKNLDLSKVYQLLEPGPVVMLSTHYKGEDNVMTMSWLTMMEFTPPLVGCIVSNRDHSFELLRKSKECVINIPSVEMINAVVDVGNTSGAKVNKFEKFHLTKLQAEKVKAPLIGECFANFECKVVDTKLVNKYNFFVLEVVKAWIGLRVKNHPPTLHHRGNGTFMIAGKDIKTKSKMK